MTNNEPIYDESQVKSLEEIAENDDGDFVKGFDVGRALRMNMMGVGIES